MERGRAFPREGPFHERRRAIQTRRRRRRTCAELLLTARGGGRLECEAVLRQRLIAMAAALQEVRHQRVHGRPIDAGHGQCTLAGSVQLLFPTITGQQAQVVHPGVHMAGRPPHRAPEVHQRALVIIQQGPADPTHHAVRHTVRRLGNEHLLQHAARLGVTPAAHAAVDADHQHVQFHPFHHTSPFPVRSTPARKNPALGRVTRAKEGRGHGFLTR